MAEGSDTPEDMAALGWVMINRIGLREFGPTLNAVIFQRHAFAFTTEARGFWKDSESPEEKFKGDNAVNWQRTVSLAQGISEVGYMTRPWAPLNSSPQERTMELQNRRQEIFLHG